MITTEEVDVPRAPEREAHEKFIAHQREIDCWATEIQEENRLEIFFSKNFLNEHQNMVKQTLLKFHIRKLGVTIDKESLLCLYGVHTSSIENVLNAFYSSPFIQKRDKTLYHYMTYQWSETNRILTWSITDPTTNNKVGTGTKPATQDIPSIRCLISDYNAMCATTRESIAVFLEETALIDYYDKSHLEKREEEIFDWLHFGFLSSGILFHIDCTEPYILRQLFTAKHTAQKVLDLFTQHDFFHRDRLVTTLLKIEVRLNCTELPLNAKTLRLQLGSNKGVFTDADEYRHMMKLNVNNPATLVDVGKVWYENKVKCLTVIEKPEYSIIHNIFAANHMLTTELHALEEQNKVKFGVQKTNKQIPYLGKTMIKDTLEGMSNNIKYQGSIVIEEEVASSLTNRTVDMSDSVGGIAQSWKTIQDIVDRVVADTNHALEYQAERYRGGMRVVKETMHLSSFDNNQRHLWTPCVKKLMDDPQDKRSIEQHVEQKINVGTLGVTIGSDEVTRRVIPCTVNYNHYTNNGIIDNRVANNNNNIIVIQNINNNNRVTQRPLCNNDIEGELPNKRKRKRKDDIVVEKIKRIRWVNEYRKEDTLDDSLPIYRIVNTRVTNPNHSITLQCMVCERHKVHSNFYEKKSKKDDSDEWGYERNICHACVTMKKTLDTKK